MGLMQLASMGETDVVDWAGLIEKVKGPCSGCPRQSPKSPVIFDRKKSLANVEFIVISQEPGFWLNSIQEDGAEVLERLCKVGNKNLPECKKANPLSKVLEVFGNFDPNISKVYWTHALKCVPSRSDKDVNKDWRRAATRCHEMLLDEIRILGKSTLNIIAFGKYALELCLYVFDNQDIDQDLSISEFMQSNRLPLTYKIKFKNGTSKTINLFVYTNPSSEVVNIRKSGGKMTAEEIQDIETKRVKELMSTR